MSSVEKWKELEKLGRAKFLLRERALIIGGPVGLVYSLLFSGADLSSLRGVFSAAFIVPVLASMVAGIVFGAAEWAEAREKSEAELRSRSSR
jgi:phosphate/sulfate permease